MTVLYSVTYIILVVCVCVCVCACMCGTVYVTGDHADHSVSISHRYVHNVLYTVHVLIMYDATGYQQCIVYHGTK